MFSSNVNDCQPLLHGGGWYGGGGGRDGGAGAVRRCSMTLSKPF